MIIIIAESFSDKLKLKEKFHIVKEKFDNGLVLTSNINKMMCHTPCNYLSSQV